MEEAKSKNSVIDNEKPNVKVEVKLKEEK